MATKTAKSLNLPCPKCGACDNPPQLDLNLNDLDEITCGECSETFSADEAVARFVAVAEAWKRVAAWIEAAPVVGE
jgi:hypothetical protein